MFPFRFCRIFTLLSLAMLCILSLPSRSQSRQNGQTDADRAFTKQSYALALRGYQAEQKRGNLSPERRDLVAYRIAVCLGKTEKWTQALQSSLDFVRTHRGTVWEPRGLYRLGRLYRSVPHMGYRIGKTITRGYDVPAGSDDQAAERVNCSESDARNGLDALEAAATLYDHFPTANAEQIQLDFGLEQVLQWNNGLYTWAADQNWLPPSDPLWHIDPTVPYDRDWPFPKKELYLLRHIVVRSPRTDSHTAGAARLAEIAWLHAYQGAMRSSYAVRMEKEKPIVIPFPYSDLQPEKMLRALIHDFPRDSIRYEATFTLAQFRAEDGDYRAALALYRTLAAAQENTFWASLGRRAAENVTAHALSFDNQNTYMAGKPPILGVNARNLSQVHLEVYRIPLPERIAHAKLLQTPDRPLNDPALLGKNIAAMKRGLDAPLAAWDRRLTDWGDYRPQSLTLTLPTPQPGVYLVVASAPGVTTGEIVLVSNLTLVQRACRESVAVFAADAHTGAPISQATILARESYYEQTDKGQVRRSLVLHGVTDRNGLCTIPLTRKANRSNFSVVLFGQRASDYALTNDQYINDYGENSGRYVFYTTTDRSVYRPQQEVRYRQVVMERTQQGLKPVVGKQIHVVVSDAKGRQVHAALLTSSSYGSVSGQFALPDDAPLGEYSLECSLFKAPEGEGQSAGGQFRVEEYKRPEFTVTVTPAAERVKLGDPIAATVSARYYFGGPVPNARVTYRVHRTSYAATYRFPQPFDFLYNTDSTGDYDTGYRNGQVVLQGVAHTDANGDAKITIPTAAKQERNKDDRDQAYWIEADVLDSSRRTITGSGVVKATAHDVFAFLNYPRGYALTGDDVAVEVMTLNPSDTPISVEGTAKVYRQPETLQGKETLVYEHPLATDTHGRGYLHWKASTGGYYRVAFVTKDTGNAEVTGSLDLWVQGSELAHGQFQFRDVKIAVQQPYYQEGQTAKVLLVTPQPNCTVLFTREVENRILEQRIITISGRSKEIEVPITHADVPNVFLSAIVVREGQVFQAQQELFVPPTRQLAQVSVTADKERYEPGEKAHLHLVAKDWAGNPIRMETSVSISDASLEYIQKSYAPDIRVFCYGDRRSDSIGQDNSLSTSFAPINEDHQHYSGLPTRQYNYGLTSPNRFAYGRSYLASDIDTGFTPDTTLGTVAASGGFENVGGGGSAASVINHQVYGLLLRDGTPLPSTGRGADGYFGNLNVSANSPDWAGQIDQAGIGKAPLTQAALRKNFADTAFWTPVALTDSNGQADIQFTWPDNLTQWKAQATGNTTNAQVGTAQTSVTTRKDLLVRLQAPRFLVEKDQIVLSANVQNYLPQAAHVKVSLDLNNNAIHIVAHPLPTPGIHTTAQAQGHNEIAVQANEREIWVDVPKDGERRVDWTVQVDHPGAVTVRMTAQSQQAADATETAIPVLIHGVERAVTQTGVLAPKDTNKQLTISLPTEHKPGTAELVVEVNASLGAVMLDALPYLNDYPYGCVEQTMSRFLPSVLTAQTLQQAGYKLEDLRKRARALELQAQQGRGKLTIADSPYTYADGKPGTTLPMTQRWSNPVFDTKTLNKMVASGMDRLEEFQHKDGGWGWWKEDESDAYMTAYVLYGLMLAKQAGYAVPEACIPQGYKFLKRRFAEESDLSLRIYEARVLAMDPAQRKTLLPVVSGKFFAAREPLPPYTKALLALTLHTLGEKEQANTLLDNLENTIQIDADNGTVHWDSSRNFWWRWYNNTVETNATILQAYLAIRPQSDRPEMLVKWLVNHRTGEAWSCTRETALAVMAVSDYVRAHHELQADYTLTLSLGGKVQRTYTVTSADALLFDNRFVVPDALLHSGEQQLSLSKQGSGSCYYSSTLRYFSQEEKIPASAHEIGVTRRYYKLLPGTASGLPETSPTDANKPHENPFLTGNYALVNQDDAEVEAGDTQEGPRYQRVALKPEETIASGDLIEVELELTAANDYDYVLFEDIKPSGCEPVDVRSGEKPGLGVCSNRELREEKVAFFISHLPQGRSVLSYRMRAEAPGSLHVLPSNGGASYAPQVRAISDEGSLHVLDTEP